MGKEEGGRKGRVQGVVGWSRAGRATGGAQGEVWEGKVMELRYRQVL